MPRPVLLDTNMLLAVFEQRIDVFGELERLFEGEAYEPLVLEPCLGELEKIASGVGAEARAAKSAHEYARKLIAEGRMRAVKGTKKDVDEAVRDYALAHSAVVATNDFKLKRELRSKGVRVVTARDGRYLVFT